jgi:hypothetical protein
LLQIRQYAGNFGNNLLIEPYNDVLKILLIKQSAGNLRGSSEIIRLTSHKYDEDKIRNYYILWLNSNLYSFLLIPTISIRYRVAGKLHIGKPLPPHLFEIAVGLILGDVYIYRNKSENASLHVEQSINSKDYLLHLYDLFKDYTTSNKPIIRTRINKISGNFYSSSSFAAWQLSCFTQIYCLFYQDGRKIVPRHAGHRLTSVGLAYWAMDDGNKQGSGFHLNTQAFTLEEVELLSNVLINKFGIQNTIQHHKNGYRIYILSKSMESFKFLVKPYFHNSMIYKLN